MPQAGGWKRILKKLLLIPLGMFLAVGLVELVLQVLGDPRPIENEEWLKNQRPHFNLAKMGFLRPDDDPEISFTLQPGFEATIEKNVYRINAHGMRSEPIAIEKPQGQKRVIVLGDSYAFGLGVDQRDTVPAQLQEKLRPKHPGIQVLNMGVPAYQTGQEEAWLRRDGLRFDPDLVVLVYYPNDNMEFCFHYDPRYRVIYVDELPLPAGLKHPLARSILYYKVTKAYTAYLTRNGDLNSQGDRHWPVTSARLKRIAEMCEGQGVRFLLAALPALVNSTEFAQPEHPNNKDHRRVLGYTQVQGIARVDLHPPFMAQWHKHKRVLEDFFVYVGPETVDSHLNREGIGVVVEAISARIEELQLLR